MGALLTAYKMHVGGQAQYLCCKLRTLPPQALKRRLPPPPKAAAGGGGEAAGAGGSQDPAAAAAAGGGGAGGEAYLTSAEYVTKDEILKVGAFTD